MIELEQPSLWNYNLEETNFIALQRYKLMRIGYIKGIQDMTEKMENDVDSKYWPFMHMHHVQLRSAQVRELMAMFKKEVEVLSRKHLQLEEEMQEYMNFVSKKMEANIQQQD